MCNEVRCKIVINRGIAGGMAGCGVTRRLWQPRVSIWIATGECSSGQAGGRDRERQLGSSAFWRGCEGIRGRTAAAGGSGRPEGAQRCQVHAQSISLSLPRKTDAIKLTRLQLEVALDTGHNMAQQAAI